MNQFEDGPARGPESEEIHGFSLNRMRGLAQMSPEKQREWLSRIWI